MTALAILRYGALKIFLIARRAGLARALTILITVAVVLYMYFVHRPCPSITFCHHGSEAVVEDDFDMEDAETPMMDGYGPAPQVGAVAPPAGALEESVVGEVSTFSFETSRTQ